MPRLRSRARPVVLALVALGCAFAAPNALGTPASSPASPAAAAATATRSLAIQVSDGVTLRGTLLGAAPLQARPLVMEFTPYGQPTYAGLYAGPDFNYLTVYDRGTGDSGGAWNMMGDRSDADIAEVMDWACHQSWSSGAIALQGFSASAIAAYNAMRNPLPCLKTTVLGAGTYSIYRDLVYIGGIPNAAVLPVVGTGIGAGYLENLPARLQADPASTPTSLAGLDILAPIMANQTEDAFWTERVFGGDADRVPILENTGFFDPEERGPFQTFQATRQYGSHLFVEGAHDGAAGGNAQPWWDAVDAWLQHYLRGADNGVTAQPAVSMWIADGSRENLLAGTMVHLTAPDWPVPGTQWQSFYLDSARSGTARSLNDGTLTLQAPGTPAAQPYPYLPSNPLETDPGDASAAGSAGVNQLAGAVPSSTEMNDAEPVTLSYTSAPLKAPLDMVGPGNAEIFLSSTAPETDINVVVADVWPDGSSHPVGVGRLRTSFPYVDVNQSLVDANGDIVQPHNDLSRKTYAAPGTVVRYDVEIWPIGNRFGAGHRIRVYLTGTPLTRMPTAPALNTVHLGGATLSRVLLPVLP